jgi:carbonic anhydrase
VRKLLTGILDFRRRVRPTVKDTFAKLAFGQRPDTLLFACSDSRVAVNVFASTEPGDMLVVRNAGNIIPPPTEDGKSVGDLSEVAVLEFGIESLGISSIIVCGHSECGAISALMTGAAATRAPHLHEWVQYAEGALDPGRFIFHAQKPFAPQNLISQRNVLLQLEHLRRYPFIAKKIAEGKLRLYGWWFDIAEAEVYAWDEEAKSFFLLDEVRTNRLIATLDSENT